MIALLFALLLSPASAGEQRGLASFYSAPQRVACPNVGRFNPLVLTAAHRDLPCGTKVRVKNLLNGREVIVEVNDRGPFVRKRIIDLSRFAADLLDIIDRGVAPVSISWKDQRR